MRKYFTAHDLPDKSSISNTIHLFGSIRPNIPITLNGGYRMPGWFDLTGLTFSEKMVEDEKGMLSTVDLVVKRKFGVDVMMYLTQICGRITRHTVNQLIRSEVDSGTPSNRIVLGGFSQGSAMSLLTGLTSEYKMASDANKKTPIFMGHGDIDPVVQYAYGSQSAAALKAKGYNVDFHSYPGVVHTASDEEIADVANFLKKVLPSV
ncbi:hypothetical protein INT44_002086 [Umbelopsis vinacea]|uniref:Acyl-protein thioesterase 1 n=1 Tax=Umbelopsis vinacea TaxID=44442 RepID=A0A8H7Q5W8_9FUNG|nr:hypothetical protein INT44_002086 [Umbelopsis vinacea]